MSGITVGYGGDVVLDRFSLDVEKGEVLAIIGPSGSGKSTLLRAVAGLEPLMAGTITAGGRSLDGVATHRRDLGLMFQDHALFPHMNVADNIAFGLRMSGWSVERRRRRVVELLDLVGLASFGSRSVDGLSGGEAQRVALARALAPEPSLLMLDEPFGSLDRVLREQLTAELRHLLAELGQTALHVTHDQAEAFALAARVAVLREGRLEQVGEPAELWRAPRSVFVAEFVGHANIWPVDIVKGVVSVSGRKVGDTTLLSSGSCRVVIPTTAVRLDPDGALTVTVVEVEFRDGRHRVTARLGEEDDAVLLVFDTAERIERGRPVSVSLVWADVHRLDGDGST